MGGGGGGGGGGGCASTATLRWKIQRGGRSYMKLSVVGIDTFWNYTLKIDL